jgi:hypothetical protein
MLRVLAITLIVAALAELINISAAVGAFLVGLSLTGEITDRAREVLTRWPHPRSARGSPAGLGRGRPLIRPAQAPPPAGANRILDDEEQRTWRGFPAGWILRRAVTPRPRAPGPPARPAPRRAGVPVRDDVEVQDEVRRGPGPPPRPSHRWPGILHPDFLTEGVMSNSIRVVLPRTHWQVLAAVEPPVRHPVLLAAGCVQQ